MSSTTISTLDRKAWSSVSQLRWSRRPVTTTLAPLVRLSATFSARSRQHATSKNETDSSHSLVCWFCHQCRSL